MTAESCILRLSDAYQNPEAEPELEQGPGFKDRPGGQQCAPGGMPEPEGIYAPYGTGTEVCRIPGAQRSRGPGCQ